MLRFLADEDFNGLIVLGLRRARPEVDILRVQAIGLMTVHDTVILDRSARDRRVLLTHDVTTMTRYAYDRVREGAAMSGVLAVHQRAAVRGVIENLLLVVDCLVDDELEGQVRFIPQ